MYSQKEKTVCETGIQDPVDQKSFHAEVNISPERGSCQIKRCGSGKCDGKNKYGIILRMDSLIVCLEMSYFIW